MWEEMTERIVQPVSEIFGMGFMVIATASSGVLIYDNEKQVSEALMWLLLPFLGSCAAAVSALWLNPHEEERKRVMGRGIIAVVIGTTVPKLTSLIHPWLKTLYVEPAAIFLSGFTIAVVAYILSKSFVQGIYARSDRIAKQKLDEVEDKLGRGGAARAVNAARKRSGAPLREMSREEWEEELRKDEG